MHRLLKSLYILRVSADLPKRVGYTRILTDGAWLLSSFISFK
jgi:hypothetical protein